MPPEDRGIITKWDDAKGFGFIKPGRGDGPDIFLHISDVRKGMFRRPLSGDVVYYQIVRDAASGKPRACNAYLVEAFPETVRREPRHTGRRSRSWVWFAALVLWPICCSVYVWKSAGNIVPLVAYAVVSLITLGMYHDDKRRAQCGEWRISEASLHAAELFGGWPGALIGQRWFRHKTSKGEYLFMFWVIVLFHAVGWFDHLVLSGEIRKAVGQQIEKMEKTRR